VTYDRLRVDVAAGIAKVTLARPEKRNALDRRTADELVAVLDAVATDAAVRAVALLGDGPDFCAGADLEALHAMGDGGLDAHRDDALALGRVFTALRALPRPVVAVVQGRALAGGAGLASACDIVLAHEGATFGYPEVRVGFVPAMVMTVLRRAVGERAAADLVLTGRHVGAAEAVALGLATRVIADGDWHREVANVLTRLAQAAPGALATTKRLLYDLDGVGFAEGIRRGAEVNAQVRSTAEFREGVRRFVEKDRG
jgi:methylglutaconyl-CoA hydratase